MGYPTEGKSPPPPPRAEAQAVPVKLITVNASNAKMALRNIGSFLLGSDRQTYHMHASTYSPAWQERARLDAAARGEARPGPWGLTVRFARRVQLIAATHSANFSAGV
jgi:hypothetical protein